MTIKYPFGRPILGKSEVDIIKKVLDSNILVHGQTSLKFENIFKKFIS